MPKTGTVKCREEGCGYSEIGNLPSNKDPGYVYKYFEEGDYRNDLGDGDPNLVERIIQHHKETEEIDENNQIESVGHPLFRVEYHDDPQAYGEIIAHKKSLTYKEIPNGRQFKV